MFIPLLLDSTYWPDDRPPKPRVNLSTLPSAPRAATVPNIDPSRLPKSPPFTVFLGNLSYEANEDDIRIFFERNKLTVTVSYPLSFSLSFEFGVFCFLFLICSCVHSCIVLYVVFGSD